MILVGWWSGANGKLFPAAVDTSFRSSCSLSGTGKWGVGSGSLPLVLTASHIFSESQFLTLQLRCMPCEVCKRLSALLASTRVKLWYFLHKDFSATFVFQVPSLTQGQSGRLYPLGKSTDITRVYPPAVDEDLLEHQSIPHGLHFVWHHLYP